MADAPFEPAPEDHPASSGWSDNSKALLEAALAMAAVLPIGKALKTGLGGRAAQALRTGEAVDKLAPAARVTSEMSDYAQRRLNAPAVWTQRGEPAKIPRGMFASDALQPNVRQGIFKDPRIIAQEAAARYQPEDPALREVFGVTRQQLADLNQNGQRQGTLGNLSDFMHVPPAKGAGSELASRVATPKNAQRIIDANTEALRLEPRLADMQNWYPMDPAYDALRESSGNMAPYHYDQLQKWLGSSSPGSPVEDEIKRGLAARYLSNRGEFDLWKRYGGSKRGSPERDQFAARTGMTSELVPGHPYHSTSQLPGHEQLAETGDINHASAKVPSYVAAHGHPEVAGNQTIAPIGDTHWAGAVGLDNVRIAKKKLGAPDNSVMRDLQPWWQNKVAHPMGMESVPGQALTWGVFSKQTGVDSPVGPSKLELLAKHIKRRHQQLHNQHPEWSLKDVRDRILQGKLWGVVGAGALGGEMAHGGPFAPDTENHA